jgi:polyisoprenoid-binding protein YceI
MMRSPTWYTVAVGMMTLSLAAGCDNNPGKDKARATVGEAASVVRPALDAEGYTFSQDGSKIEFVGAKVTGKHDGSFAVFSGRVNLVQGAPERSSVEVEMARRGTYAATLATEGFAARLRDARRRFRRCIRGAVRCC